MISTNVNRQGGDPSHFPVFIQHLSKMGLTK